jgi:DNA-binding response OmpR family regulator
MRVLVVDDEPEIRDVLNEYLRSLGHDVRCVGSGREAVEGLASGDVRYELALVDWHMPGITGRDVLEGIAAHSPTTRVLVITGHVAERVGKSHLAGLIARVCHKPFSLRSLKAELETLLAMGAPADASIA